MIGLILAIGIIVCIIPIAIIVLIVLAITKKNKENKNDFSEAVRNIYVYIILIITLTTIIVGTISTFRMGLDILFPEKSIYQTKYQYEERERNQNIIDFFTEMSLVASVIPVFIYHNKIAKKARKVKIEESKN